ncbi:MAG: hypothetical protein HY877_04970 [Deltaproteobacteria bacterium]|nr:hypothetical protein [Deltaproteobacteria bacterium]
MQIIKTTARATVTNGGSDNTPPVDTSSSNSDLSDLSDIFTGSDPATQETAPRETAPIDDQSIDFLFGGSIGGANGPSGDQFAPNNVVTLDEWLMEHPEGRMFLDQFITKMKTVRDKFLIPRKEQLEKALIQRGLSVSEAAAIQAKIDDLTKTIAKVNGEIGKAEALREGDKATYQNELYSWPMQDLNGDGYIGDPNDPENSFIVAKHPVTGQEVILNAKTKQPAVDPYLDMRYEPALIDEKNVSLISRAQADQNPGKADKKFDVAMKIKTPPAQGFADSTFGAQIDMVASEGFWVEKDPATGKPILLNEPKKGESSRYKLKAFTTVTREDGKKMVGQETPTAEERGKYVFVRASSIKVSSEPITYNGKELDAGHVYIEYKNKDDETIAIIRVEGTTTDTGSPLAVTDTNYIAATSVGVSLTSGKTADDKFIKHSNRISPIEIDASDLSLTSKILQALPGNTQEIEAFYKALGIPPEAYDHNTGEFLGDPGAEGENLQRSRAAGNFTLSGGFLSPTGNDPSLAGKFGYNAERQTVASRGVYLPNDSTNNPQFRESITGVAIIGFRGSITGTQNNDIIVVPPPDEKQIRELLPIGAKEITPDNPAYGTYVDAGSGRNFVYSGGGDIAVKSASFFWQEDNGKFDDDTNIYLDNHVNNTSSINQGIFVHIGKNSKQVNILNGEDSDPQRANKDTHDGVNDDYYSGPANMKFTHQQNDTPGGMQVDTDGDSAQQIGTNMNKMNTDIKEKVIRRDPLAVEGDVKPEDWEYGKQYEEWAKTSQAFFNEWEFFQAQNGGSEETEGVLK